jgi:hypothetical protein
MATSFPTALDILTNPSAVTPLDGEGSAILSHAEQHATVNDAIEAIETVIGVSNSADEASMQFKIAKTTADVLALQQVVSTTVAPIAHTHSSLVNDTATATLDANGNFVASGNVTAYSDIRLKSDIEIIENALSKIKQIRGVTYNRSDLIGSPRQTGIIAQEVQAVIPEAIVTDQNGILAVTYGGLVGILIEAIKELSAKVDQLTSTS